MIDCAGLRECYLFHDNKSMRSFFLGGVVDFILSSTWVLVNYSLIPASLLFSVHIIWDSPLERRPMLEWHRMAIVAVKFGSSGSVPQEPEEPLAIPLSSRGALLTLEKRMGKSCCIMLDHLPSTISCWCNRFHWHTTRLRPFAAPHVRWVWSSTPGGLLRVGLLMSQAMQAKWNIREK